MTAYPWITRVFAYTHATVRLNFFRVTAWSVELHPHEGRQCAWQINPPQPPFAKGGDRHGVFPILPANAPVLRALELPALYAISNAQELGEEEFIRRLEAALRNGLRLVQLREKDYSREALRELALKMLPLIRQHDARLIINADIELSREIGADGGPLTGTQLAELSVRPAVDR